MKRLALALLGLALLTGCEFKFDEGASTGSYGTAPVEATDANFAEVVLGSSKPVMVDCFATWCGPCKTLKPTVHEMAADYEGRAVVAQLDIDDSANTARRYEIHAVPTLLFFKDGKLVDKVVGVVSKAELESKLDALLSDSNVASAH